VLDASSGTLGNDGTVEVNSPDNDISGSITALPASFLNAASLLSQRCAARTAEEISSFVIVGRGGVPHGPDNWALSSYMGEGTTIETKRIPTGTDKAAVAEGAPTVDKLPLVVIRVGCQR
jgi:large exoprotein involved in heme utilization and adhesion